MKDVTTFWQGIKFAIIGGLSAIIYFCIALLFDKAFGLPPILASNIAYVLSAVFSYLGHKLYTFNTAGKARFEALRFAVSSVIGFTLASLIPFMLSAYPSVYSYLVVLAVVPATTFILLKFFVFAKQ
ncbi:MAG TPA: GtrA family protein [Hellea balneolensis]|uniref:GtrA family protein n=1 Tax=Hellea balneolensis TaxID=287478 RepID=A0A7C5QSS0_9PROT|nr:GtrA family protein [Hellea balneolensis]